jgi:prophage regulatory protein
LKDLPSIVGLSESTIEAKVHYGQFPQPFKLSDSGRAVAWLDTDIAAWQASRIATRRGRVKRFIRSNGPQAVANG